MRLKPTAVVALVCTCVVGAHAATADTPEVTVTDHGVKVHDLPNHRRQTLQEIAVTCAKTVYALTFRTNEHLDTHGKVLRHDSALAVQYRTGGTWRRSGTGWYVNDTFHVFADGLDLGTTGGRLRHTRIREQGRSALIETTLDHPRAQAQIRLAYRPGQQGIDVQVRLQSAKPVKQLRVRLACYPAFFTAWNKRRGDRWVVTPVQSIEEPREPGLDLNARTWKHVVRHADLDPVKEWWLFYYDRFFNSAEGKGKGVCGLVVRPGDLRAIALDVSDYSIVTHLDAKPSHPVVRFTLWQQNMRDYAGPLKAYPAVADAARRRLADPWLFAPRALVRFDKAVEQQPLARLTGPPAPIAALRKQFGTTVQALERFRAAPAGEQVAAEQTALAALRAYRLAFWQCRRRSTHPRRILALLGAHFPQWQLDAAAKRSVPPVTVDTSHFSVSWRGERLSKFPATADEMLAYDAIVMVNVSATPLRDHGRRLLEQFVANGGGLLVCGGFYALGGGAVAGTPLEDVLPVALTGPYDVKQLPTPARIVVRDAVPGWPTDLWKGDRVVMWLHDVTAKPGATVPLAAQVGDRTRPTLVLGTHKRGRVAVLPGTVYGQPGPGQTAFWDTPDWPTYLSHVLAGVCGGGLPGTGK